MRVSPAAALIAALTGLVAASSSSVCPKSNSHATGQALDAILEYKKSDHEIMAGYFRSWRDIASDSTVNKVAMDDIPDCMDIVFVFPNGNEPASFGDTLKNQYVPTLRARGTKLVRTYGINHLIKDTTFPNDESGWKAQAKAILDEFVYKWDLDGLDLDVEGTINDDQLKRAIGVIKALSASVGPKSGTGKLLIYDTNKNGDAPLFRAVSSLVDYVLIQAYGHGTDRADSAWASYKPYINSKQFLMGFSFYEERGGKWGDVQAPIKSSHAYAYATWEPKGAKKGGIFSYALDRDGVKQGDDRIQPTDFSWTRQLITAMNP